MLTLASTSCVTRSLSLYGALFSLLQAFTSQISEANFHSEPPVFLQVKETVHICFVYMYKLSICHWPQLHRKACIMYLVQLLNSMENDCLFEPGQILEDNQGAITLCRQRYKHVDVSFNSYRCIDNLVYTHRRNYV